MSDPVYGVVAAFAARLAGRGVVHAVISPGSRSAALALCLDARPDLETWIQVDERCAGFFALGLGRASGCPAVLVCTSGTAAANYLPAVVEASHAGVPLIVCTADRPPELRGGWGSPQTIDQAGLYGAAVRWSIDLPVPQEADEDAAVRWADDCFNAATGDDPGPVHLNWPLREPLEPSGRVPVHAASRPCDSRTAMARTTVSGQVGAPVHAASRPDRSRPQAAQMIGGVGAPGHATGRSDSSLSECGRGLGSVVDGGSAGSVGVEASESGGRGLGSVFGGGEWGRAPGSGFGAAPVLGDESVSVLGDEMVSLGGDEWMSESGGDEWVSAIDRSAWGSVSGGGEWGRAPGSGFGAAPVLGDESVSVLGDEMVSLSRIAGEFERGVVVVGAWPGVGLRRERRWAVAAARFAAWAGWPLIAEPASHARGSTLLNHDLLDDGPRAPPDTASRAGRGVSGGGDPGPRVVATPCVVATADHLLADTALGDLMAPDVVVLAGRSFNTKPVRLWIERTRPRHVVLIDPENRWQRAVFRLTGRVHASVEALSAVAAVPGQPGGQPGGVPGQPGGVPGQPGLARPGRWLRAWRELDGAARRALRSAIDEGPLLSARVACELADALPSDSVLVASNSMPVRDLDAFVSDSGSLLCCANRGASGIDGTASTALGVAAADRSRTVALYCGDLALLHDLGGLTAAARLGLHLVAVCVDNDGGEIFSLLPVAERVPAADFERLFRTPHGIDLSRLDGFAGIRARRADSAPALRSAVEAASRERRPGVDLIVVDIPRDADVAQRRALTATALQSAHRTPVKTELMSGPAGGVLSCGPPGGVLSSEPVKTELMSGPPGGVLSCGPVGGVLSSEPVKTELMSGPAGGVLSCGPVKTELAPGPAGSVLVSGPGGGGLSAPEPGGTGVCSEMGGGPRPASGSSSVLSAGVGFCSEMAGGGLPAQAPSGSGLAAGAVPEVVRP